jgi:hypothetical protein
MVLAVRRRQPLPESRRLQLLRQGRALMAAFGIERQALLALLRHDGHLPDADDPVWQQAATEPHWMPSAASDDSRDDDPSTGKPEIPAEPEEPHAEATGRYLGLARQQRGRPGPD